MKWWILPSAAALLCAASAGAQTPPPPCAFAPSVNVLGQNQSDATITCTGIGDAAGKQFTDLLNKVLQDRIDPQKVLERLDEVERIPEEGVVRTVSDDQRQRILQSLYGKPTAEVAISAHPLVEDSAEFAQALAMPLVMAGWQIEGNQIRRRAPKPLEPIQGLALIVKDRGKPPQKALQLRAALAAAQIGTSLVTDPGLGLAPDAVLLWIGRRAELPPAEPPK
jgi:hypothetical protein